jgi:hypothetical protein
MKYPVISEEKLALFLKDDFERVPWADKAFADTVGKRFSEFEVTTTGSALRINYVKDMPDYFLVSGDCCSDSWISDIFMPDYVYNDVITSVIKIPLETSYNWEMDARTRQKQDKVYGYRFNFESGKTAILAFRNSSNGYYGGSVDQVTSSNLLGVKWCECEYDEHGVWQLD